MREATRGSARAATFARFVGLGALYVTMIAAARTAMRALTAALFPLPATLDLRDLDAVASFQHRLDVAGGLATLLALLLAGCVLAYTARTTGYRPARRWHVLIPGYVGVMVLWHAASATAAPRTHRRALPAHEQLTFG